MAAQDFEYTLLVDASAQEAFNAINNVPGWWNAGMKGKSEKQGDEFEVQFGDMHYTKHRLVEVVPNQKVEWLTLESNLSFVEDHSEWTGTKVSFEIGEQDGKTTIRFMHEGLSPQFRCYGACSGAWPLYLENSLKCLIEKGKGQPGFPPEEPCE